MVVALIRLTMAARLRSAPVLADEREQAVCGSICWCRAADHDLEFPGELLQFDLPQPGPVRAAAVGGDQPPPRGSALGAGCFPPQTPRCHGRPADVVGHVPVGGRLAEFLVREVMNLHFLGPALRPPLAAGVLEIADQFLLPGVGSPAARNAATCSFIWPNCPVHAAFAGLRVGRIAKLAQKPPDKRRRTTLPLKTLRKMPGALRNSRPFRVAPRRRRNQRRQQTRLTLRRRPRAGGDVVPLLQTPSNRRTRNAVRDLRSRPRHCAATGDPSRQDEEKGMQTGASCSVPCSEHKRPTSAGQSTDNQTDRQIIPERPQHQTTEASRLTLG